MEELGRSGEKREVLDKDRLVSEYVLPTVLKVIEVSKKQAIDCDPDFYSVDFDHENDHTSTHVSFETDCPDDERFCIDIDMTHIESSPIVSLPAKEISHTMKLLEKSIKSRNSKKIYELSQKIREGSIDSMMLERNTIVDVGFNIDMTGENIEIIKTKIYRTVVEGIEIDRIAVGVSEENTPLGLCRLDIEADCNDYETVALACQLIQAEAAGS